MKPRAFVGGVVAVLVAIGAVGCASSGTPEPAGFATTPQTWNCGLSPGTAGTFRPQLSYCEY